jgi:hypothetical protein
MPISEGANGTYERLHNIHSVLNFGIESIGMLSKAYRIGRGEQSVQKWAHIEYASICGIQLARWRIRWIPEPRT